MQARSAPFLKKESVVLTDTLEVFSNADIQNYSRQILSVGPNGLNIFGSSGTAKPQAALWSQYGEMYEFYQVDGFSSRWIPNKFEYNRDNNNPAQTGETVIVAPTYMCIDPEGEKPETPSSILSYGASKVVHPYSEARMQVNNYKALAIQKQQKTMLSTAGGDVTQCENYSDAANIVTWIQNPRRGGATGSSSLGWIVFSVTYTFSGMKRPGARVGVGRGEQPQQVVP